MQLGLGTPVTGTFDAALFSGADRWLEVRIDAEVLTPRQLIGSVPWALIAQQANKIVPDPNGAFEDCGDGTVWDPKTNLVWEKKTGTVGSSVDCETVDCPDPHDVNNLYAWSISGTDPDGGAFTDFLDKLNDPTFGEAASSSDVTGCFAGHCDWRLPNFVELRTIGDASFGNPSIDPIFSTTASSIYWSASRTDVADIARAINFQVNAYSTWGTENSYSVRAVRAGSCH